MGASQAGLGGRGVHHGEKVMGGTHRIVKSLVALMAVVFIGLVGLLDYEVLLLIRHQSTIEATVKASFSKVDDVLLHMREQVARLATVESGLQDVKNRVSGLSDRYAMLQENQQSLLARFDSLVTRVEVAFNNAEGRRADYAELLRAYQESQQALVELQRERDAMTETMHRLDGGSLPSAKARDALRESVGASAPLKQDLAARPSPDGSSSVSR